MGRDGARPEDHRRRHRDPRPHPDGLRKGRGERRPGAAPQAAHLRHRRRRTDRRRARRRHRRAGAQGDRPRFPQHRFLDRARHPRRGRAAAAHGISRKPVAIGQVTAREARRRGAARPCGHAMRRARRDACRRRSDRLGLRAVGGRRHGIARREMAGRRGRPRRPRHRQRRSQRARPSRDLRASATRRWSRARMDSRCRASRRPPSRWAATPPG